MVTLWAFMMKACCKETVSMVLLDFTFGFMLGSISCMVSNPSGPSFALPVLGSSPSNLARCSLHVCLSLTVQNIPQQGWYQERFSVFPLGRL